MRHQKPCGALVALNVYVCPASRVPIVRTTELDLAEASFLMRFATAVAVWSFWLGLEDQLEDELEDQEPAMVGALVGAFVFWGD